MSDSELDRRVRAMRRFNRFYTARIGVLRAAYDTPTLDAEIDTVFHHALADLDLLIIENVGNLVCPAEFDVGAHANAMVYSVTEGEEKPLKYPVMFRSAGLVIVNKVDEPDQVASVVQGAAHLAFNTWKPVAVLIGQRVLGAKNFKELARK